MQACHGYAEKSKVKWESATPSRSDGVCCFTRRSTTIGYDAMWRLRRQLPLIRKIRRSKNRLIQKSIEQNNPCNLWDPRGEVERMPLLYSVPKGTGHYYLLFTAISAYQWHACMAAYNITSPKGCFTYSPYLFLASLFQTLLVTTLWYNRGLV